MAINPIINDRRNKIERRRTGNAAQFPIITTQGSCIRKDRRCMPERRISNIVVKEWSIKSSIFNALFEDLLPKNQNK